MLKPLAPDYTLRPFTCRWSSFTQVFARSNVSENGIKVDINLETNILQRLWFRGVSHLRWWYRTQLWQPGRRGSTWGRGSDTWKLCLLMSSNFPIKLFFTCFGAFYLSWPAVSQISNLTVVSSKQTVCVRKAAPIVDSCNKLNKLSSRVLNQELLSCI